MTHLQCCVLTKRVNTFKGECSIVGYNEQPKLITQIVHKDVSPQSCVKVLASNLCFFCTIESEIIHMTHLQCCVLTKRVNTFKGECSIIGYNEQPKLISECTIKSEIICMTHLQCCVLTKDINTFKGQCSILGNDD